MLSHHFILFGPALHLAPQWHPLGRLGCGLSDHRCRLFGQQLKMPRLPCHLHLPVQRLVSPWSAIRGQYHEQRDTR
jgi:hypothetical protein